MIEYSVEVTDTAFAAIRREARYIAVDVKEPENANRWLELLWDAVDALERIPRGAHVAEEQAYVDYEVRQLVVGTHLVLFTIDDERQKVWIVGVRRGQRRPRPEELPPNPSGSDHSGTDE